MATTSAGAGAGLCDVAGVLAELEFATAGVALESIGSACDAGDCSGSVWLGAAFASGVATAGSGAGREAGDTVAGSITGGETGFCLLKRCRKVP